MKKSLSRNRFLTATVSTAVVASMVVPLVPFNVLNTLAAGKDFPDVKEGTYYYDAVTDLASRGVINGFIDGTFKPSQEVNRAQAAQMIASSLSLNGKTDKDPGFTDVKQGDWYYNAVAALVEAGVISGKTKDSFKPNDSISRAEVAKFISLAYKLKENKESVGKFSDVNSDAWYGGYVGSLVDNQITDGYTPTSFGTEKKVTRGQIAAFIYRAEMVEQVVQDQVIEKVTDDAVTVNGVNYKVAPSLASLFNQSNGAALKNAVVKFDINNEMITNVDYLELTKSGTDSNKLVLDAKGAIITGSVKVRGDFLSLKNLTIKGNLDFGKEAKNIFSSNKLVVEGITTISSVDSAEYSTASSVPVNQSHGKTVSIDQVQAATQFSLIFNPTDSNFNKLVVAAGHVTVHATGSSILQEVNLASDVKIIATPSAEIRKVNIQTGASTVEFGGNLLEVIIAAQNRVTINGTANIGLVIVQEPYETLVNIFGRIGKLQTANREATISLNERTQIDNLLLLEGMMAKTFIRNYDQVKNNIAKIGGHANPDLKPDPTPEPSNPGNEGGGSTPSPSDNIAPHVSGVVAINTKTTSVDVKLTSNEAGKAYYVVLPEEEPAPSKEQIKAGQNSVGALVTLKGNKLVIAATEANFNISGLTAETRYKVYVVTEDGANNLSAVSSVVVETLSDVSVTIDKGELKEKIDIAETKDESEYTESSWVVFEEALLVAKQVEGKGEATQAEVNEALENLNTTMNALVEAEASVASLPDLRATLINENIKTINITADITGVEERIVLDRAVTINGGGHTISFTDAINDATVGSRHGVAVLANNVTINDLKVTLTDKPEWQGSYALQVYHATGVILNDFTGLKADAALLVNGSDVELTGTTTVSGNEFGGIEVSKGTEAGLAKSQLTVTGTLVNETEAYKKPTIWLVNGQGEVNGGPATTSTIAVSGQTQYYLVEKNATPKNN